MSADLSLKLLLDSSLEALELPRHFVDPEHLGRLLERFTVPCELQRLLEALLAADQELVYASVMLESDLSHKDPVFVVIQLAMRDKVVPRCHDLDLVVNWPIL